VRPTQQGTVYLWTIAVFSVTLLLLGENLVFLLGSLALGCAAVAWFLAGRNLRSVACRRATPRRTAVGAPTALTWEVTNARGTAAVGIEIEDRPARASKPVCLQVEFPSVPGHGTQAVTHSVGFGRRGVVDLSRGEATVASTFPLGLFRASCRVAVSGRLVVRPREGRPTPRLRRLVRGREPAEARQRRLWRGDDVIYGVREYREGDDPRRIHWRSTARKGALVVSEWRAEQGCEAVVVLGRGVGAGPASGADFERAVSTAATVWRLCAQEQVRADLFLGVRKRARLEDDGRGLDAGFELLTRVRAQGGRRPRRALARLAEQTGARTVVYVAAGPERGLERDLAAAAGRGGSWTILRAYDATLESWVLGLRR